MCHAPREVASSDYGSTASATTGSSSACMATTCADALPHETTLHLLDFLDAVSLAQCAQTFSTWRRVATTDLLWHRRCKSEFGIDGGKADYTSRWKQERQRALANLQLYIEFLDEIYFSLVGFFALVSLCAVFPLLVVLKLDGWLMISWTQAFGCIYGLGLMAVLFVLVRITLLATLTSPLSSLKSCIGYSSAVRLMKIVLGNRDVARKVAALAAVSTMISIVPLAIHLFADGYLATPRLAAFLVIMSFALAMLYTKQKTKAKRHVQLELLLTCAFATSALQFGKAMFATTLPWCAIVFPLALPSGLVFTQSALQHAVFNRVCGRPGLSSAPPRRVPSTDTTTRLVSYYHHYPPLASVFMIALKMDGWLTQLPWTLVLVDYSAWAVNGPLALLARQLVQVMFREMPIPANLRKL